MNSYTHKAIASLHTILGAKRSGDAWAMLCVLLLLGASALHAQPTVLRKGDAAIVGVNANDSCPDGASGQDVISFVFFRDIKPGTIFTLTDNGYHLSSNKWNNTEGLIQFTNTGPTIPRGTLLTFRFPGTSASLPTFITPLGNTDQWAFTSLNGGNAFNMAANGDQLYMFGEGQWTVGANAGLHATWQGEILYAFNTKQQWIAPSGTGNNRAQNSDLHPDVDPCYHMNPSSGTTGFMLYTGSLTSTDQGEWIKRIAEPTNWTSYSDCSEYRTSFNNKYSGVYTFLITDLQVSMSASASSICAGNPVTLTLNLPSGSYDVQITEQIGDSISLHNRNNISNGHTISFTPNATAEYSLSYILNTDDGCPLYVELDQATLIVNVTTSPATSMLQLKRLCVGDEEQLPVVLDADGNPVVGTWTYEPATVTSIDTDNVAHTGTANHPIPVEYVFTPNDACLSTTTLPVIVAPLPDPNNDGIPATILRTDLENGYEMCAGVPFSLPLTELQQLLAHYDVILTGPSGQNINLTAEYTTPAEQVNLANALIPFAETGIWQAEVFYENDCPYPPESSTQCNGVPYPSFPCSQVFDIHLTVYSPGGTEDQQVVCSTEPIIPKIDVIEWLSGSPLGVPTPGGTWSLYNENGVFIENLDANEPIQWPVQSETTLYYVRYTLPNAPSFCQFSEVGIFVVPGYAGEDDELSICSISEITADALFAALGGTPNTGGTWSPIIADVTIDDFDENGELVFTYTVNNTYQGVTCEDSATVTVTLGGLQIEETITQSGCGEDNGTISLVVSGGEGPYTYAWVNAQNVSIGTSQSISNLAPGSYTVTVTDSNNCSSTETYTITEEPLEVEFTPPTQSVFCVSNTPVALPAGFNPNITGTWYLGEVAPENIVTEISLATAGVFTYTFVPNDDCVVPQTFPFTVTVNARPDTSEISASST
ncbi:MAG: SprB repeat-containing protein [Weeksellaceae bacterium]|nr:SprB repeat-containing protein [Weeksellaceae bacterium]